MIIVMALLMVNNAAFTHVHVIPDGSLAAHAHPFDRSGESSPGKAHHHSDLDYHIFQDLQVLCLLILTAIGLLKLHQHSQVIRLPQHVTCSTPTTVRSGRAPPVRV
jgi:hypothetical protein